MRNYDEIKRSKRINLIDSGEYGCMGYLYLSSGKRAAFVFSWGGDWEHLSVSMSNQCPAWKEMCEAKDLFFQKDECCIQYHPAEKDYVNVHPYCLHIWRPLKEQLPIPPIEFV